MNTKKMNGEKWRGEREIPRKIVVQDMFLD
jgi:hypothetical protein